MACITRLIGVRFGQAHLRPRTGVFEVGDGGEAEVTVESSVPASPKFQLAVFTVPQQNRRNCLRKASNREKPMSLASGAIPRCWSSVAKDWKRDLLKYLRTHGAIIAKDAGIEKFDGYNESWLRSSFPATSLKELPAFVENDEAF